MGEDLGSQASVPVQLGFINPEGLPVTGADCEMTQRVTSIQRE